MSIVRVLQSKILLPRTITLWAGEQENIEKNGENNLRNIENS